MSLSDTHNEEYMIPTYYRNLGVYYEKKGDYTRALSQYNKAINTIEREPKEYKVFVTYVSALLKELDRIYDRKTRWPDKEKSDELNICRCYIEIARNKAPWFADVYIKSILLAAYEYVITAQKGLSEDQLYRIEDMVCIDTNTQSIMGEEHKARYDFAIDRFEKAKQYVRKMQQKRAQTAP